MTRYSKQTRLSVNMAEVGAYSFSKLEKTVEDNLVREAAKKKKFIS